MPLCCSYHSVTSFCDLLLNRCTLTWNLFVKSIMSRFGWSFTQKALGRTFMKTRPPTRLWKFWVTYVLKKAVHIAVKMSNEMEVSKVEKFQSQNTQLWIASLIEYGSVCLQFAKVATDSWATSELFKPQWRFLCLSCIADISYKYFIMLFYGDVD